jgi:hypothetical protein
MKKFFLVIAALLAVSFLFAGTVEKTYRFDKYKINAIGTYKTVSFDNTVLSALPGEPMMPYMAVSLMLPPGEIATGIEVTGENETVIPGTFEIYPQQYSIPLSQRTEASFVKNKAVYSTNGKYPSKRTGELSTQYMNGYAFALCTFTPMTYNPALKTLSYFSNVTVKISTRPDIKSEKAMTLLTTSENAQKRVRLFIQNPEMINQYPAKTASRDSYQYLVITSSQFANGFDSLLSYYADNGIASQVVTTQYIYSNVIGHDNPQKIRNFIKQEVTNNNIEYVLLGGDVEQVPYRGFYCFADSDPDQEDFNIPADLYYSALDGEWNDTTLAGGSTLKWGEPGEDDLLPDVSVARCPYSNASELENMVHKTLYYQKYPVQGELNTPFFAGEYLYSPPPTWGGDYMELLIDDHNDNGYFTFGIPSADNVITKMYDSDFYTWSSSELITEINKGHSFIHHLGHANETYVMRLVNDQITNQTFNQVNGVIHNYTLVYTQGCLDGSFDYNDCIAEKMVTIDNFAVAGIFNSRFGWFNQGTTDGPSQHLQREFVSAMYNDTVANQIKEIGSAHMMSKIKTAPYIGLPGEFEPGAQRWVHYDCNVLGDPALMVWTDNPSTTGIAGKDKQIRLALYPNPAKDHVAADISGRPSEKFEVTVLNSLGQKVISGLQSEIPASGSLLFPIDVSGLSTGFYMVMISANSTSEVRKLTITR